MDDVIPHALNFEQTFAYAVDESWSRTEPVQSAATQHKGRDHLMCAKFRVCLLSMSVLYLGTAGHAAPPRLGQGKQPPEAARIFIPHGGYLRTTAAKHLARRAAQRNLFIFP